MTSCPECQLNRMQNRITNKTKETKKNRPRVFVSRAELINFVINIFVKAAFNKILQQKKIICAKFGYFSIFSS